MNDFNKYLGIMFLIMGSFLGLLLFFVLLFFILKLLSITVFTLPGFNMLFQYIVTIIPYLIFFGAYYFLFTQIGKSENTVLQLIAKSLILTGVISCFITMIVISILFFGVKMHFLHNIAESKGYILVSQLVILVLCSVILAIGEPKEKDWMERENERMKE